jgi:hypothetical protein
MAYARAGRLLDGRSFLLSFVCARVHQIVLVFNFAVR